MYRDAEQQFKSALKHRDATVDVYLYLCKVYVKLDQPNTALRHYKEVFWRGGREGWREGGREGGRKGGGGWVGERGRRKSGCVRGKVGGWVWYV